MKEDNKVSLNAFALVGFVLGLLSIGLYWVLGIIPVLAIIFSIIGLIGAKKMGQKGKGLAIAGLILGILYTGFFGIKVFLRYNNYSFNDKEISIQEVNPEDKFIGTWEDIDINTNTKFVKKYYISKYTYMYECIIYQDDVIEEWFTRSGTIQFFGDIALATKTHYTNMVNSPIDYGSTNFEIDYDYLKNNYKKID